MKSISKDLMGASSIPIVLSILEDDDSYGYEIVQRVKEYSRGKITWNEPSVYPVLKKLVKNGLIKSYWKVNPNERPRKYYTILEEGKKQLAYNRQELETVFAVFAKLWSRK